MLANNNNKTCFAITVDLQIFNFAINSIVHLNCTTRIRLYLKSHCVILILSLTGIQSEPGMGLIDEKALKLSKKYKKRSLEQAEQSDSLKEEG